MTTLNLDLAALAAELEELTGWTDFTGVFIPETPGIYCWDCGAKESAWFIDGETYCAEHFGVRILRMVEEARQEAAAHRAEVQTAAVLAERAQAEGLTVTVINPEQLARDTGGRCRCHHKLYVYTIEGTRYCLSGAIAILREVLG